MKESRFSLIVALALTFALAAGAFFAGVSVGKREQQVATVAELVNQEEGKPEAVDFSVFWKAWNTINEKYVTGDGPSDAEKVWGAVKGLAESLGDPYTVFFTPEELKMFEESITGNFQGVGMEVGMRNDALTVIAPLKGTPAERAGIRAGDRILQIDDTPTNNLSVDRAVQLIRGEKGTTVALSIYREGESEPLKISIIRDIITIPTLETELAPGTPGETTNGEAKNPLQNGVFVIRLFNFNANAGDQFRGALRDFVNSESDKLLLDLRGNPGGFLEAAVDVSSWFLPAGKTVVREELAGGEEGRIYRSKGYDIFNENLKMVILVDGGSASASEIVAGALSEHKIATLVGAKTFGKGSVQELVNITDYPAEKTALKITIARWLTPNGVSISEQGITPDVEVEITAEDLVNKNDPQLDRALEVLNGL